MDVKDDLTDNPSYADGNLAALNAELVGAFGSRLYTRSEQSDVFPSVDALRDRVLCVLSGDEKTRLAYLADEGKNPSIAVNSKGQVVEIHDSGSGELWYWTGQLSNGAVSWKRHGRYDTGRDPVVLLDDQGNVVEVHDNPSNDELFSRVGSLGTDLELTWGGSGGQAFPSQDTGVQPSLAWVGATAVREVHKSPSQSQHWYWNGAVDFSAKTIVWTRNSSDGGKTSDPLYVNTTSSSGGQTVVVSNAASGPFGTDTLLASVNGGVVARVAYEGILFVESQFGGSTAPEADGGWFFAADGRSASDRAWAASKRSAGKAVRLWEFNDINYATTPAVNFGATDTPAAAWYQSYCQSVGCVEY